MARTPVRAIFFNELCGTQPALSEVEGAHARVEGPPYCQCRPPGPQAFQSHLFLFGQKNNPGKFAGVCEQLKLKLETIS
jgi:hypothetical protein